MGNEVGLTPREQLRVLLEEMGWRESEKATRMMMSAEFAEEWARALVKEEFGVRQPPAWLKCWAMGKPYEVTV